ncbi:MULTISPECIES: lipopolysaccharide assembly protein LapB [unclassified Pseudomonas]|uniref:tetratricopeptide repeat protein n=1 Tax=unclassified Pseudomonas TaxID=196821 RepID=UPI00119C3229|nr:MULTISPECIES: tetratricopeptide repeat protein [unclassified Pseudomonas]TWC22998.1 Tfp pilus assembly protein PilF [Pseudomonas sp. SJZ075]TWC24738.1 Tfp pilus assembly protein PilF [Pseudomonas sp. SJZ074]TWC38122.1 Tfp pilus assembly protein PilF [Pseudomonas sp. SJZ078]TWC41045.1 Tfp pilus assembly protein PilF [Pseudomonas sp. SJZ085]TWC58712.1 Tfp pilus assembly protein PilF [Pseudomonas sp. SJZ124]
MPSSRRYLLFSLGIVLMIGLVALWRHSSTPQIPEAVKRGYSEALAQARNGLPGAARMLYQQLGRPDLSPKRRVWLHAELPNYPSPQALKLADADLHNESPDVRRAAIGSIAGLVPTGQRSLLLGPLLDDDDSGVRFAAVNALLGLSPDDLGLYFGAMQLAIDTWEQQLEDGPQTTESLYQLARLYLHNAELKKAQQALEQALRLQPNNLPAVVMQIEVLDKQGQGEAARQLLARQLQSQPQSAYLQHALGMWLLQHGQSEYAVLGLAKAVELEPDNRHYRYDLATTLHAEQELEAAQKQLQEIVQRYPADRKARVLLINYWKETGQLQNVQILLAKLEQLNPDDPALQQGL